MDLNEIRAKSNEMLADFVDEIGFNGQFYISGSDCPITWGRPLAGGTGEFVTPGSKRLEALLQTSVYDEETKKKSNERGLILINPILKNSELVEDLYIATIHETIHSNRNLLIFDATRDGKNEAAYVFNNDRFEQNTSNYGFSYADASQEILKGNIDTSKETVDSYKNVTSKELERIEFTEGKRDAQMEKQYKADEALVELMAVLSYRLHSDKEKGNPVDVWKSIEKLKDEHQNQDIRAMCKIILRHQDFELFHWMIDPISYSQGDIHYDFFGRYTEDDQDLLQELYDSDVLSLEELLPEPDEDYSLGTEDSSKTSHSSTLNMEELLKGLYESAGLNSETFNSKKRDADDDRDLI